MGPLKVTSAPTYDLTIGGQVPLPDISIAPQPSGGTVSVQNPSLPALPVSNYNESLDYNNSLNDYYKVDLSLDPTTKQINISAPQYYVDSPEFQEQVLPAFKQLEGKELNDTQVKSLTDAGVLADIQRQADDVRKVFEAKQEYKAKFPKATDQDATLYLQNTAAGYASDKDANTQVVTGFNQDDTPEVMSVADVVKNFKELDDTTKGSQIKGAFDIISNPDTDERTRAIQFSLVNFLRQKGLLKASAATQWDLGMKNFLAQSDKGLISNIAGQITRIGNNGQTAAQAAREDLASDPRSQLEGLETANSIGSGVGRLFSLVSDVVGSGAFTRLAGAAGQAALGARGTDLATRINQVISGVEDAGTIGRVAGGTARTLPSEATFGASQAITNDNYDTAKEFAINVAANGAALGAARIGGKVLSEFDQATKTPGTLLNEANDLVSRGLARGWDSVSSIPGLSKIRSTSARFVDSEAPIRQLLRGAYGRGQINSDEVKAGYNDLASMQQRGAPQVKAFVQESPEFDQLIRTNMTIESQGGEALEKAKRFISATQEKQYADAGRIKVSKARQEELEKTIDETDSPELQSYRQDLINFNDAVTRFGEQNGLLDNDILQAMRSDEAFKNGYVRLQRELDPEAYTPRSAKRFKDTQVVQKLKGGERAYADPFESAIERLHAFADLSAQNRIRDLVARSIDEGWTTGRILQAPETIKARNDIRSLLKSERTAIGDIVTKVNKEMTDELGLLVDDAESLSGPAAEVLGARIDNALEDIVDAVVKDPRFKPAITKLTEELGNVAGADRTAALEAVAAYRPEILQRIQTQLKNVMGPEDRETIDRMFRQRIDDQLQVARAQNTGLAVETPEDLPNTRISRTTDTNLRERQQAQRELNKDISSVDPAAPGTVSFTRGGTKGYFEVDDPVLRDYFNNPVRNATEDGYFAKAATLASRLFRLGTTGLNPVYLLVNASRDIPQSAVLGGVDVLSPRRAQTMLMESAGLNPQEAQDLMRRIDNSVSMSTTIASAREPLSIRRQAIDAYRAKQPGIKETAIQVKDKITHESLRALEAPFNTAELAVRKRNAALAYARSIQGGATREVAEQNAIFAARETTANFLNVGRQVNKLVRTMPYLTAAINGKASFLRMWNLDPIGVTTRLAAGVVTPLIFLAANNMQDDDTAAAYLDIPEWERRSNIIIMLGPDNIIKIPMAQELAAIANPFIERVEVHHGLDKSSFETFAKAILGQSPVNITGLATTNSEGNVDLRQAAIQAGGTFAPQIVRPAIDLLSGTNAFTGAAIAPSDQELYDRGQVAPGDEITAGDRTFAGRDSFLLRKLADATGFSQASFQNVLQNYTGAVGGMILNSLDRLAGAPEEQRGGKSIVENAAQRFFGKSYSQANQDYYRNVNSLEKEKEVLQTRLEKNGQDAYFAQDPNNAMSLNEQRRQLIDEYGEKVADFVTQYSDFYNQTGGLKPYQLSAVVRLLDFGPTQGAFEQGSFQNDLIQQARNESSSDAARRATDLGLPTSNERDRYGQLLVDAQGNPYTDYGDTSLANSNINQRIYGTPKQVAYEFEQITKADKKAGTQSLYDIQQKYYDRLDPLYAKAKGLKGDAAQAVYDEISRVQEEYMTNEFDPRIRPLIEKYGPEVLMNNNQIFEELGSRIMIPNDFTPFFSKKKTPYLKRDTEAYLLDRYGVGTLNEYNLPNDQQGQDLVNRINSDIQQGRTNSARSNYNNLRDGVDSGRIYVDTGAMEGIRQALDR